MDEARQIFQQQSPIVSVYPSLGKYSTSSVTKIFRVEILKIISFSEPSFPLALQSLRRFGDSDLNGHQQFVGIVAALIHAKINGHQYTLLIPPRWVIIPIILRGV